MGRSTEEDQPPPKRARTTGIAHEKMKAPSPEPHLAKTPATERETFSDDFIEELESVLIQPEWFDKWEGYFKD